MNALCMLSGPLSHPEEVFICLYPVCPVIVKVGVLYAVAGLFIVNVVREVVFCEKLVILFCPDLPFINSFFGISIDPSGGDFPYMAAMFLPTFYSFFYFAH